MLAKADASPLSEAQPMYNQLAKMLQDEVVYIPLYYSVGAFLIKPYVKGAGTNSFFDYPWNQIQIQQH
jgi:ABC-type oligopeptide transport system substrate-binding subunit